MGSAADKIAGNSNEAVGKAKQDIGQSVGSDKLHAKGAAQEAKGHAQKAVGEAKDVVKETANKVAEKANKHL